MDTTNRAILERKILEMPTERLHKLLIFMAGMEAEAAIEGKQPHQSCGESDCTAEGKPLNL